MVQNISEENELTKMLYGILEVKSTENNKEKEMQPIKPKSEYINYLSNELKKLLKEAEEDASNNSSNYITLSRFMIIALGDSDSFLYKVLNTYITVLSIFKLYNYFSDKFKETIMSGMNCYGVQPDDNLKFILEESLKVAKNMGCKMITSDHVLLSVFYNYQTTHNNEKIVQPFLNEGLTYDLLYEKSKVLHGITDMILQANPNAKIKINNPNETPNHSTTNSNIPCCTNLNLLAQEGKIDDLIGRRKEIMEITKILNRRKNGNVILIGNPGVGKTSIVEGMAKMINDGISPSILKDKTILRLDVGDIMSGTQFRGAFETKLNGLLKTITSNGNNILFIDDIDAIFKTTSKDEFNFTNIISNAIANSNLKIIGTTTYSGYKKNIDKNYSIKNKFQTIEIDEPDINECFDIVKKSISEYEKYHICTYSDESLKEAISLSKRYISDKAIPSSVFDLLDEVGADCKIKNIEPQYVVDTKYEIFNLRKLRNQLLSSNNEEELHKIEDEINTKLIKIGEVMKDASNINKTILPNDVRNLISTKIGIPIEHLDNGDVKQIKNIEERLNKIIIGQEDAIKTVSDAIKRNKIGLNPKNKPIFSCFCVGPTGCGKSLLAKTLAKDIYGDEKYLVRFDMSEYSDKSSVNKLIGSATGYIDSDKGGLLTESVKKRKYCVLLLDEIEKAHLEVHNLFLQVLDEGYLVDNSGEKVDFKNTIILMTSNVGAERASWDKGIGFNKDSNKKSKDVIKSEMKKKFPPEFINRIDDVVYFNQLTDDNLKNIINIEVNNLAKNISQIGPYNFIIDDNLIDYIYTLAIKEKEYGARPIKRVIQQEIETPLTNLLLDKEDDLQWDIYTEISDGKLVIMHKTSI